MNILIAGSSGFIGQSLTSYLRERGHQVKCLVRRASKGSNEITWNPDRFEIPANALEQIDVVINLCGKNISDWLWTPKFRQELYESRIKPTRTLTNAILSLPQNKVTFISTSGVGIYGANRSELLTEDSLISTGFFSELAVSWEQDALLAQSNAKRVSVIRLGVVLGRAGGMIKKIAPLFKLGLGAKIGSGKNFISWVAIEDVCRAIDHIIQSENLSGAVNLVNPNHLRADDFYDDLANAFGRSVRLRVPAFLVKAVLGELAEETVLSNQQIQPKKLLDSGFKFSVNSLKDAAITNC